ncbi:9106_t:CDS:2 [Funneliformis geosporum]|uniref:16932_t:CDS:1 n=1 Tax=Funneliformis geosporum TaxID=1117311 RepID=A0A9W4WQE2_9GLOM|nr:16932_t:CDS:2 [Funneliformis geosporum]CAI2165020.1 9106_t:CDS:2 [Funneliformis geosporum]
MKQKPSLFHNPIVNKSNRGRNSGKAIAVSDPVDTTGKKHFMVVKSSKPSTPKKKSPKASENPSNKYYCRNCEQKDKDVEALKVKLEIEEDLFNLHNQNNNEMFERIEIQNQMLLQSLANINERIGKVEGLLNLPNTTILSYVGTDDTFGMQSLIPYAQVDFAINQQP